MATAHPDGSGLLQEENGPSHTSKPIQGPLKESSDHPLEKAQPHITSHSLPLPGDRVPCSHAPTGQSCVGGTKGTDTELQR